MRILGLTGAAGSGKNTVVGFLKEWGDEHGVEIRETAFADLLKHSAARALGVMHPKPQDGSIQYCNWLKQPGVVIEVHAPDGRTTNSITGREFLQFYGTEAHREVFGDEFWVDRCFDRIASNNEGFEGVMVITDPRFPNEAQRILNEQGELWRIVRPGQNLVESHASEAGLDDEFIDLELCNAGDLRDLCVMTHEFADNRIGRVNW